MTTATDDRYTVISADCHAGGSMDHYREYLDPKYADDFADWRGAYKNPFRDLQKDDSRVRNWDDERRIGDLEADGIVGEVVFPNTVPPFFPTGALVARPPATKEELDQRWAGLRAHNRWLVDWCANHPEKRAGIAQIFLNDVDLAVAEAEWVAQSGLRGGILLPTVPDDTDIEPLFSKVYDPLWRVCEEAGMPVNLHSGSGQPDYGDAPAAGMMWLVETAWFAHRPLWQLLLSGVFERFPTMKFVMTEQGCSWILPLLPQFDAFHQQAKRGRIGELKFPAEEQLPMKPSEYIRRNVYLGVSFPGPGEARAMKKLGIDRVMWGADYPHHEGSTPYSRELMRMSFSDWDEADLRQVFTDTAVDVYGFEPDKLARRAREVGPTVDELKVPLDSTPEGATSPGFFR